MRAFRFLAVAIVIVPVLAFAQSKAPKAKRAAPSRFANSGPFFEDAFKEALVGERPADLGKAGPMAASGNSVTPTAAAASSSASAGSGWSQLISATTIEDSIKSLKLQVDKELTTPSAFAGDGHKHARRDYSLLAMLFGIAAEYEGDVRWKKDAPAARDAFARSAANFKVGTPQAFQEAKLRRDELSDLVGGSSPFAGKSADAKASWPAVVNRAPLMQYLEAAWEPRLKAALADKGQFAAKTDEIVKEAELFAAIGQVLTKEGMEDADSDEYQALSHRLRDGGKQIIDAVKLKNYEQASSAAAAIGKACAECHANYR